MLAAGATALRKGDIMPDGTVFDIQRFALHDGPGIRTTVFFKGCSSLCGWCHNPESFSGDIQLQFFPKRCTGCMRCVEACPVGAHEITAVGDGPGGVGDVQGGVGGVQGDSGGREAGDDQGSGSGQGSGGGNEDGVRFEMTGGGFKHSLDRGKCRQCGACAGMCYSQALVMTGRRVTVDEVMREAMEDAPYYETSGGGVTLSGGEPVLQREFALALLKALKAKGVRTNIQTAGNYPFSLLAPLLPYLDMIMYDVKGIDPEIYENHIHGDRAAMLGNLQTLDAAFNAPIIVRTPVVCGVNAKEDEIAAIAQFIKPLKNLESYRLIPYHGLGGLKYGALGKKYDNAYATPSADDIYELEKAAAAYVPVYNHVKGYINGK